MRKATVRFVMSVRLSARNNSAPTRRILIKFDIWDVLENLSKKFKLHESPTGITGALHEAFFTVMTISRLIVLRMRNVLDKSCKENKNTRFIFSTFSSKIVPFMRLFQNIWRSQRGYKWRHNMAHTHCMLDKQGYTGARVHTPPIARSPAHTYGSTHCAHAHTNTHTDKYGILTPNK